MNNQNNNSPTRGGTDGKANPPPFTNTNTSTTPYRVLTAPIGPACGVGSKRRPSSGSGGVELLRFSLAVGGTVTLLTLPSPPTSKHLLGGDGGCSKMKFASTATQTAHHRPPSAVLRLLYVLSQAWRRTRPARQTPCCFRTACRSAERRERPSCPMHNPLCQCQSQSHWLAAAKHGSASGLACEKRRERRGDGGGRGG